MNTQNQWLTDLGNDETLWPKNNYDCNPSVINFEYEMLRDMAKKGNLYGVLLQIKDVFELLMNIPCVMGMIIINSGSSEISEAYSEVMYASLCKALAMGDWDSIASSLKKNGTELHLPQQLIRILTETRKLYSRKIEGDMTITNWRNQTIGHGALRFEDDPAYEKEVTVILEMLKKYFGTSLGRLYENLYIQSDGVRLAGNKLRFDTQADVQLYADGAVYPVSEFILLHEQTCFFFNSYYIRKKKAQFSSFMGGKTVLESREYIETVLQRLQKMKLEGHSFRQRKTTRGEEELLECLSKPDQYIKPEGLTEKLAEKMEELGKGVILIQMERGTGKSAFANQMSGLHNSSPLFEDSLSRIYHLVNASLRGLRDFSNSVKYSFVHSYSSREDIYSSDLEDLSFDLSDDNPAKSLSELLNAYHDLYERDQTILVLDGIDELTSETRKILECIPERDDLDSGVFVILLSRFEDEKTVQSYSRANIREALRKSDAVIQSRRNDPDNIRVMEEYIKKQYPSCADPAALIEKADCRFLYLKPYTMIRDRAALDSRNETEFFRSVLEYLFSLYGESGQNQMKKILTVFTLFPGITLNEYMEYLNLPSLSYTFIGILNDLMPLLTVTRHPDGNQYALSDEAYGQYVLNEFSDTVKETAEYFDQSSGEQLEDYLRTEQSFELIVNNCAVSRAEYNADPCLTFFGRNLYSLYQLSDDDHVLYSPETFVILAARLGHDQLAKSGYRLVMRSNLCNAVCKAIIDGMKAERSGISCRNPLYCYIKTMKPSYLSYLKQALKGMSSFNELYRLYTDTMGKDPLTEAFFWIIDEEPLSEGTMKLVMEKADVSAFIKYYFSTDKLYYSMDLIPPKEMLDEEAYQLLADEQLIYEGPFISPVSTEYTSDTVMQAIDAAVRELQDPAADFTKADDEDGPLAFIYSRIELFAQRIELKESLTALHRAYYERLLKEEYPVYLINALGLGNAADSFLYILNELYPGQGAYRITEWAETVYQKADPSDQRPEQLPVDLLITAVNEFTENNDTDSLFEAAELLALKYDQIGYFHKDCWDRMTEALKDQFPDETYPLFYCTPNTQLLYETYLRYGNVGKAANLFARLDAYIPEIVSWAEKNNEDTQEFIRDFFRHIRQERWLRYPYTNETLVQHFYERQLAKIRSFLETADRQADYQMLQQLMEDYLYYDACLNDPDSLQRHASELIQMIRGCEENADSDTKEILEAEVQYVQDKQNEYMHGEPETMRF